MNSFFGRCRNIFLAKMSQPPKNSLYSYETKSTCLYFLVKAMCSYWLL